MRTYLLFNIFVISAVLTSCTARKVLAPVQDRVQPSSTKVVIHEVEEGDTLYSIAWRYNLNYKHLAKANGIGSSYRIYPGQKINLHSSKSQARVVSLDTKSASKPPVTQNQISSKVGTKKQQPRLKNKTSTSNETKSSSKKLVWFWPSHGQLLRSFSGKSGLSKGIDIGGVLGESVLAASSGTVVYAGEGLRGYGKLIIIKHSEKYLSAYAHSRRLNVKEGDLVSAKEKIAEMGKSGTNTVKLHFEIRFDGQPVDPMKFLPPK